MGKATPSDARDNIWLDLVRIDIAALHITTFAIESFIDRVLRKENDASPTAMLHFQKGLQLLQARLLGEDDEIKISDSTIGIIVKLASAAQFNGDYRASQLHMEGLRKMVDVRGGLYLLKGKRLLMEILRYVAMA